MLFVATKQSQAIQITLKGLIQYLRAKYIRYIQKLDKEYRGEGGWVNKQVAKRSPV